MQSPAHFAASISLVLTSGPVHGCLALGSGSFSAVYLELILYKFPSPLVLEPASLQKALPNQ